MQQSKLSILNSRQVGVGQWCKVTKVELNPEDFSGFTSALQVNPMIPLILILLELLVWLSLQAMPVNQNVECQNFET